MGGTWRHLTNMGGGGACLPMPPLVTPLIIEQWRLVISNMQWHNFRLNFNLRVGGGGQGPRGLILFRSSGAIYCLLSKKWGGGGKCLQPPRTDTVKQGHAMLCICLIGAQTLLFFAKLCFSEKIDCHSGIYCWHNPVSYVNLAPLHAPGGKVDKIFTFLISAALPCKGDIRHTKVMSLLRILVHI